MRPYNSVGLFCPGCGGYLGFQVYSESGRGRAIYLYERITWSPPPSPCSCSEFPFDWLIEQAEAR